MKKVTLGGIAIAAVFIFAGCAANSNQNNNTSQSNYTIGSGDLVFFWGAGCSHCENVEKFLKENNGLEEKLKLKKIEVFSDKEGQKVFLEKIKECGLKTAGVPVLYKDGKCSQGDTPIIEELKKNL